MIQTNEVTCDSLLSQLSSYLDGDLPQSMCAVIEQHAASCMRCGQVIEDFRMTTGLCRSAADVPLPEDVRARAQKRVQELIRTSATSTRRTSRT